MGVRYTSPDRTTTIEQDAHETCDEIVLEMGEDPAGWTVELTPITHEVNHWPGITQSRVRERCTWA